MAPLYPLFFFHRLQALVIWILNVLYILALLRRSLSAVRDLLPFISIKRSFIFRSLLLRRSF